MSCQYRCICVDGFDVLVKDMHLLDVAVNVELSKADNLGHFE